MVSCRVWCLGLSAAVLFCVFDYLGVVCLVITYSSSNVVCRLLFLFFVLLV